jgi:hydroxymethylglutaryl-CoA lyase
MGDLVKIIECPRDAWQSLRAPIPTETKRDYLRELIDAGFRHIDAVSFVSPAAVPQMADSEQVIASLGAPANAEIIGIVVNEKGAQRAVRTEAVQTLGFPYSISPEFLRRNQHQTPEESLDVLDAIVGIASGAGLNLVAYVSMAFGNPYNEPWDVDEVKTACEILAEAGVEQISLADTVGLASANQIADTVGAVIGVGSKIEIGVHLHARREDAAIRIRAAFEAGCRRFDSAIGGSGGCPFAQDLLVGNIPTEELIRVLADCGATLPKIGELNSLLRANAAISESSRAAVQ